MERTVAQAMNSSEAADWITNIEVFVLAYAGHLEQARTMTRRAVDTASQAHQPERAAMFEAGAAVREAFFGNRSKAKQRAQAGWDSEKTGMWSMAQLLRWRSPATRRNRRFW